MSSRTSRYWSSAPSIWSETSRSTLTNGLSGDTGLRFARTVSAIDLTHSIHGFMSEKNHRSSRAGFVSRSTRAVASFDIAFTTGEAKVS